MLEKLKGWNYIVYVLISKHFKLSKFALEDLYSYEEYFRVVYPENYHIKDKLRQTLQNLRDKKLLNFLGNSMYQLIDQEEITTNKTSKYDENETVYLLSNESIPGWVKIGRTNSIERRLKELCNTSIPLPFKLIDCIKTDTRDDSYTLEKSIHSIIDTINPDLRKNTEASKREFFKLNAEDAQRIFKLVKQVNGVSVQENSLRA